MKYRVLAASALILALLWAIGHSNAFASNEVSTASTPDLRSMDKEMPRHPYVGMWVTDDGHIRHELLPNGRYDEARGGRKSAYQGRYEIKGNHIDYWDDTGFTADGTFVDANTLHHAGMIFRRR